MGKNYTALAMIGYAAYCAASNGLAFDGSPLKKWDELDEPRQDNWRANAKAIEEAVIAEQSGAAEAAGLPDANVSYGEPTETVTVAETTTLEGTDGDVTLNAGDQVEVPVQADEAKDQQAA